MQHDHVKSKPGLTTRDACGAEAVAFAMQAVARALGGALRTHGLDRHEGAAWRTPLARRRVRESNPPRRAEVHGTRYTVQGTRYRRE